ncbi:hypothetical protein F8B43_4821 [Methylorubrum populi]|uniref:Uncharacterized protein n=1 Tax=Methylorubrum populi TaxID=223967 RepID=A0A833MWB6_9HYPH|nr:hypothetical protein F8B43_4821 [Methylorubrum populi]
MRLEAGSVRPNPPALRSDRSMKKAPAACKRRGPFSYGAAASCT